MEHEHSSGNGEFKGKTDIRLDHLEDWVKNHESVVHSKIQDKLDVMNRYQGGLALLIVFIPILLKLLWPSK